MVLATRRQNPSPFFPQNLFYRQKMHFKEIRHPQAHVASRGIYSGDFLSGNNEMCLKSWVRPLKKAHIRPYFL